jgi:dihydroorotase
MNNPNRTDRPTDRPHDHLFARFDLSGPAASVGSARSSLTRRQVLQAATGLAAASASLPFAVQGAMGPKDKFDLLVRNANVLDPSQGLSGKRDIGIRYGQIEAVEASIAPERALRVLDAGGKLVTPGLIDLHCHTYPYGSAIGIPADELIAHQCTTTVVSAGDAGANNFAAYRRFIVPASRTRQFAFVHIAVAGLAGFPVPELLNIDYAQPEVTARAIAENADLVLGVKVRMSENVIARHGLEPLRRAIAACEMSGVPAKIMCHIGGVEDRALMSKILDLFRPGDILTHCYSGAPNVAGEGTNIVQDGKLLPAALAAKKRGIIFDIGHGGGSFDYTIAEAAIAQGCPPDTISSDVHVFSANSPGMPYLPWVMSKLVGMGYSLAEVVAMSTVAPARVIGRIPKLGTLQIGAPADLSILEIVDGPVSFVDTRNNKREGKMHLKPVGTVVAGVASGRPYQSPFSVR